MRTDRMRTGMTLLRAMSCLCIIGGATVAVAESGAQRRVPVDLLGSQGRAVLPGAVLLYLDSAGEQVKAPRDPDGTWYLEIPETQRKVMLMVEQADLGLLTGEAALPANPAASLHVFLERRDLRIEVVVPGVSPAATDPAPSPEALQGSDFSQERQGGDQCSTATVIGSLPFHTTGVTVGAFDDYDEICPYSGSTSADVVYSYSPAANTTVDISLCYPGTTYDTKLYVYEGTCPGTLVACNDDTCPGYVSELTGVNLTGGNTYYIIVDGYGGAEGSYEIDVSEGTPPPPPPDCPAGTLFGQPTHTPADGWSAGTSEVNANGSNYLRADNFSGLTNAICDIHWWGLSLYNDGFGWYSCTDSNPVFEIKFYNDAGGVPGGVVATYTVTPTIVPTGELYAGFELNYYSVDPLDTCVSLSAGWVSIQGFGDTTCWFLWMSSGTGDGSSYFNNSGIPEPYLYDNSLCLTGPSAPIYGACCDDATGACTDNVDMTQCSGRFEADTLCADLLPPCGNPGACCDDATGACQDGVNEADCVGRHAPGVLCADLDPVCGSAPTGACCIDGVCYPDKTEADCLGATPPGTWFEGLGCTPDPCVTECDHTIVLTDDYGDGWNGGFVDLYVNGGFVGTYTLTTGAGPVTYTFQAATGDTITTVYTAGSWSYENEYHIYDVNGTELCGDGVGGTTPVGCATTGNCGADPCEGNQPANDECTTATPVSGPYPVTVSGDNTCAGLDCPGVLDWHSTWWAIDLPYASNNMNISFCGNGFEINNVGIVYYNDCNDCSAYIVYDSIEWYGCSDGVTSPQIDWLDIAGPGTVYFPVYFNEDLLAAYTIVIDVTENVPPTGACCDAGTCLGTFTEAECAAAGGDWNEGTDCATFTCPVPPPNDFCEDAITVGVPSQTAGSTILATEEDDAAYCGTSSGAAGVWYKLIGTGNTITASTCVGSDYDTKLKAYCGDCSDLGGLTCVAGNDDSCGLQSEISWCSQVGAEYLILVYGYSSSVGNFTLDISDDGVGCAAEVACLPEGGCCLADGSCLVTTEGGCAAEGGSYNGDDTDCSGMAATDAVITVEILTDNYGSETSWELFDQDGNLVADGGGYSSNTLYTTDVGVYSGGCYSFTIYDSYGDGICCGYGTGYYNVYFDGGLVATGGEFGDSETVPNIGGCTGAPGGGGLGACCVNINESCAVTTEECCDYAGGVFHGAGTNCGLSGYVAGECSDAFEDISGTGTLAPNASDCDDCGDLVPIGFTFNFYGDDHTDVAITSNGYLTFGSDWTDYSNDPIPDDWDPNDFIAPMWDDLISSDYGTPDGDIHYQTLGTAPDRRFIAQWTTIRQLGNSDSNTFQAVLYEGSNDVAFRYQQITPESYGGDYTIGIENQDGTDGVAFDSSIVGAGDCLQVGFIQSEPPCPDCFGLNKVELKRNDCICDDSDSDSDSDDDSSDRDGDSDDDSGCDDGDDSGHYEVEIKGSWIPATPIDLTVDDVTYTIEDGFGYLFDLTIPAGSFQPIGGPNHDKWKFDGDIGLLETEAKFDFDRATFKLEVEHFQDNDLLTGNTLTVRVRAGANVAGETVVADEVCEELEYKRHPKLDCLADGVVLLQVVSDQGVFDFVPAAGQEMLPPDTVVDDGVNGPVTIHTSGSQPLDIGDVFYNAEGVGAYVVTDVAKIHTEYSVGIESSIRGVPIGVGVLDLYGDGDDTTDVGLVYTNGAVVNFTAPRFFNGKRFRSWMVDGVQQPLGVRTIEVTVSGQDHTARAQYLRPRRKPPMSTGGQQEGPLGLE